MWLFRWRHAVVTDLYRAVAGERGDEINEDKGVPLNRSGRDKIFNCVCAVCAIAL